MTGAEWGVVIVGTLGGLGGLAALLNAFFGRGKARADTGKANADANAVITSTAMEWIAKFEEQAESAKAAAEQAQQQAAEAKRQASEVQVQMDTVSREARALASMLTELRAAIMRPDATIEGLRLLVSSNFSH